VSTHELRTKASAWGNEVGTLLRDAMPGSNAAGLPLRAGAPADGELELPVFRVASRVGRRPSVRRALREAQEGAPIDRLPLVVIKDEGPKQTFVAMPFDAFLLLVSAWWAATQPTPNPTGPDEVSNVESHRHGD
jgi:hypothetical protein